MPPVLTKVGIPGYRILRYEQSRIWVELAKKERPPCPQCTSACKVRSKGRYKRRVRHLEILGQESELIILTHRYRCHQCDYSFLPNLPGVLPYRHSSEPFRERIARQHHEGICQRSLARIARIGEATVERIYAYFTRRKAAERQSLLCPVVLGIDEHTLHKGQRFATTFCDLKNHRVFDIAPGKSARELEPFLSKLQGREKVKIVCIDLSAPYRDLIRKWFPNAKIVADRFHVVRVVITHFMALCREIVPEIKNQRGFLALLRKRPNRLTLIQKQRLKAFLAQHPALGPIYAKMHAVRRLMNQKHQTKKRCVKLIECLLRTITQLKESGFNALQTLASTLEQWLEPIACMWRFTKNNGITEGFHRKMKLIQRRAYGFRNFENYRLRVLAQCG